MTGRFAWVVPSSVMASLWIRGGVAAHYALPVADAADVVTLPGSLVYIVVRDREKDFLFARVSVDSVDECEDGGGNSLGYVLNVNAWASLRFIVSCEDRDAADYATIAFARFGLGLSRLTAAHAAEADAAIRRHAKILVIRPTEREISRLRPPVARCPSEMAASVLLQEIASEFAVSELWGSARIANPLANFAVEYLRQHTGFVSDGKVDEVMADLAAREFPCKPEEPCGLPLVNLIFEPIVTDAILARRFVAREGEVDLTANLKKTEEAERRHQAMLKDIAGYLLTCGMRVLQSPSVDLAFENGAGLSLFEIKSVCGENAVSQISKGLFQLLHYADALERCGRSVSECGLIIEANLSPEAQATYARILSRADVSLFVYDAAVEWPKRLRPRLDERPNS